MRTIHRRRRAFARAAVAVTLLASLAGVAGITLVSSARAASAAQSTGAAIVSAAASQAGVPYCIGGGGVNGPSQPANGLPTCAAGPGFDCMSLAQYAVFQATGITVPSGTDVSLPGVGTLVAPDGTADLEPGDVVFFGGSSLDDYVHSGIYAGDGEVWDALVPGTDVQEHGFGALGNDYGNIYWGAVRYTAGTTTTTTTTTSSPTSPPSFGVTSASLAGGLVSSRAHPVTYTQTLKASGGSPPYKWSLVKGSGSLPDGLRLKSTGVITGKATEAGGFTFEVRVVDKKTRTKPPTQQSATRSLSIVITAAP
jgi:cell wall-associated NlpC family hydrolase